MPRFAFIPTRLARRNPGEAWQLRNTPVTSRKVL